MKILITGGKGQLGQKLQKQLQKNKLKAIDIEDADITDMEQVQKVFQNFKPEVVIHCAAYTQVDKAEEDRDKCMLINGIGTRNIAVVSEDIGAKLVYISTDYVFDGRKKSPYFEWDQPNPISVYGMSKYWGEQLIQQFSSKFFIMRSAWLYGKGENNFVKTIQKLAKEKEELTIVNDQIGSSTSTLELAKAIKSLINTELYGIYHASCEGKCSWYDFAKEIVKLSNLKVKVKPIPTKEFPQLAKRPSYSYLENFMLKSQGLYQISKWQDALREYFKDNG